MTYNEIKAAYQNEEMEFGLATQAQVDKLCKELDTDIPQMRWDDYQKELQSMMAEFL